MVSRSLLVLINLLALRYITVNFETEQIGIYSFFLSVYVLVSITLLNPVTMYFYRMVTDWHQKNQVRYRTFLLALYYFVVCVLLCVFCLIVRAFGYFDWFDIKHIMILCVYVFLISINQSSLYFINIVGYGIEWAVLTVSLLAVAFLAGVVFTEYLIDMSAISWFGGYLVANLMIGVAILYRYLLVFKKSQNKYVLDAKGEFKELYRFSIPLVGVTLCYWIIFNSQRLMIGELTSLEMLGFFSAVHLISMGIFGAFEAALQQLMSPIIFKKINDTDKDHSGVWSRYFYEQVFYILILYLGFFIWCDDIVALFLPEKYNSVAGFIWLSGLIEVLRLISNQVTFYSHVVKDTKIFLNNHVVFAVIALATIVPAVIFFGVDGAFYQMVVVGFVFVAVVLQRLSSKLRMPNVGTIVFFSVFLLVVFFTKLVRDDYPYLVYFISVLLSILISIRAAKVFFRMRRSDA